MNNNSTKTNAKQPTITNTINKHFPIKTKLLAVQLQPQLNQISHNYKKSNQ